MSRKRARSVGQLGYVTLNEREDEMRNSYVLRAPASMMLLTQFLMKANRTIRGLASATLLTLFLFPAASRAANVTVGCPGATGGPFNYSSLSAALSALPLTNVTITVSGTCTEAVVINAAQNLDIVGTPGAGLVDPGGNPANFGAVIEIDNSQTVILQGLSVQVASRPAAIAIPVILVQSSGNVRVVQCRLEGAGASDGIDMFQSTVLLIGATVIENNNDGQGNGEGVFLQGPNSLLGLHNDSSGHCPLIQGNGDNGILATGGGASVRAPGDSGCVTIQNNGLGAVVGNLGATIGLNVSQSRPGAVQLLNNSFGIIATNGSRLAINGPTLIQGNTVDGIRLRNASGALSVLDGTSGPTIQQNGTSVNPPCCSPAAGVSVANNSELDISAGLVTDNSSPGVLVQDNSSVRFVGSLITVTRNPIGVEVIDVSSAALFLAPSISGNTKLDLVCGPESVAHGDNSAVGRSNCPQFRHEANPSALTKHGKPIP
jgi:hypothetical protein